MRRAGGITDGAATRWSIKATRGSGWREAGFPAASRGRARAEALLGRLRQADRVDRLRQPADRAVFRRDHVFGVVAGEEQVGHRAFRQGGGDREAELAVEVDRKSTRLNSSH